MFRVWDPEQDTHYEVADGELCRAATYLAGQGRAITISVQRNGGQVQGWSVASGRGPLAEKTIPILPAADGARIVPDCLTGVSSRPGGPCDYVAVLLRASSPAREHRIRLLALDRKEPVAGVTEPALGRDSDKAPPLATSPGGQYLAVAGNRQHEIDLYPMEDLIKGRG